MAELSTYGVEVPDAGAGGPYTAWEWRHSSARLWALAAAALVLGLAYAPNFRELIAIWGRDPNYSHGYLVIPVALAILVKRLSDEHGKASQGGVAAPWWGWLFLAASLAIRAVAYEREHQWLETATLLPVVASLTWTFGGWPLVRRAWPAIGFLVFMLPLPQSVNGSVALPLQWIAAMGSGFLLQLSGLWVIQKGNVINLSTPHGVEHLDVAVACSGLRMLMTLAATVTATVLLIPMPNWKRLFLLASAVPVALISNMTRIVATGWCYYLFEGERAKEWAHDVSGWLMMLLALALVWLELRILSWLIPEGEESEDLVDRKTILAAMAQRR